MTELQSALLLRRQLAGERRGAGPRSRADEPLASSRPLGGREGGSPRVSAGRPVTLLARLKRVLGAGTRPSLALGRAGRPGRLPPPPRSWGVAGEGRGSWPSRPSPRGGSRAQVRRRPRDLWDRGACGPRATASPSPGEGRRAKLLARRRGVRVVRADNKSDGRGGWGAGAGRRGFGAVRDSASPASSWHELGAAPPVWGRVGAGAEESHSLAGRGFVLGAAPAPAQARSHRAVARLRFWPGAAAECLPRGVSVPLPHCPGLRPFAASRLTF